MTSLTSAPPHWRWGSPCNFFSAWGQKSA